MTIMEIAGKYVVQYLIIKLDSNDQILPGEDLNISNLSLDRSDRNKSESPTGICIRWMDLSERKSCDFVESLGTHFQWIDSRGEFSYRYSIVFTGRSSRRMQDIWTSLLLSCKPYYQAV